LPERSSSSPPEFHKPPLPSENSPPTQIDSGLNFFAFDSNFLDIQSRTSDFLLMLCSILFSLLFSLFLTQASGLPSSGPSCSNTFPTPFPFPFSLLHTTSLPIVIFKRAPLSPPRLLHISASEFEIAAARCDGQSPFSPDHRIAVVFPVAPFFLPSLSCARLSPLDQGKDPPPLVSAGYSYFCRFWFCDLNPFFSFPSPAARYLSSYSALPRLTIENLFLSQISEARSVSIRHRFETPNDPPPPSPICQRPHVPAPFLAFTIRPRSGDGKKSVSITSIFFILRSPRVSGSLSNLSSPSVFFFVSDRFFLFLFLRFGVSGSTRRSLEAGLFFFTSFWKKRFISPTVRDFVWTSDNFALVFRAYSTLLPASAPILKLFFFRHARCALGSGALVKLSPGDLSSLSLRRFATTPRRHAVPLPYRSSFFQCTRRSATP